MIRLRHSLTQLAACVLLLGCETSLIVPATDADVPPATFKLCDGSDDIRLAYQSGGGFVDEGYGFEQPYGFQFLFVDGHCDFILARHENDTPGGYVNGHLSRDAAEELTQRLMLESLPTGVYFDTASCPDAGSISLATASFYGDCSCGCDDGSPAGLEHALAAMDGALQFLRPLGAAASGEVELAAKSQGPSNAGNPLKWPFDWPLSEIDMSVATEVRALQGADAQTARELFAEARQGDSDKAVYVESEGTLYRLFMRERVDPALAQRITQFQQQADPRLLRPIAACQGDAAQTARFGSAVLDRQRLYTSVETTPVCGMRICWDGDFQEKQPVVAPLRVVKTAHPRPCLGTPQTSFQLDLTPVVEAFDTSYPGAKIEIELSLPGYTGEALKLTE